MSRLPKDYAKGKVYCVRNTVNDDIYIGSTCQSLSQRMAQHRLDKGRERSKNRRIYKMMNEVDDDNVFYIELIEDYPCENLYQLRKRQGELIREINPQLNMQVECRNKKEYYEDNKQYILSRNKGYYEENKDYFNEWKRSHYEENKERINEQRKTYRDSNKQKTHEKQREWYENNKEEKNRKNRERYHSNKQKISERRKELKALKKQTKEN